MADEKRLIDANALWCDVMVLPHNGDMISSEEVEQAIKDAPTVDAVEVVRCKDCQYAKPYNRMDRETGCYCQHPKCTFRYGTNWERLYMPIREAHDFCSYGERKDNERKAD